MGGSEKEDGEKGVGENGEKGGGEDAGEDSGGEGGGRSTEEKLVVSGVDGDKNHSL